MKESYKNLVISINSQGLHVDKSWQVNENDKPNFGDIFINLRAVAGAGCKFTILKSSSSRTKHEVVCNGLRRTGGIIRLRLGEMFAIDYPDIQDCLRIFSVIKNDTPEIIYDHLFAEEFIHEHLINLLEESRRIRQSKTDKMRNNQEKKNRKKTIWRRLAAAFEALTT